MAAEEEEIALTREYEQALTRYRQKVKQLEALLFKLLAKDDKEVSDEKINQAIESCQAWKNFLDDEIKSSQIQRKEYITKA